MKRLEQIIRRLSPFGERCLIAAILVILLVGVFFTARLQQVHVANGMRYETAMVAAKSEMQTIQAFSSYYSEVIMPRAKGAGMAVTHDPAANGTALPFPMSMVKDVSGAIAATERGETFRFYSDFPWKFRETGGPADAFERRALDAFTDGTHDEMSEIVETPKGLAVRYALPIFMKDSCVGCHNASADSPRAGWKAGDMRGAVSVSMDLPPSPSIFSFEGMHWSVVGFVVLIVAIVGPCIALFLGLVRAHDNVLRDRLSNDLDHAVQLSKAKTDFLACTSHELRTPLNAIIGFSEMMTLYGDTLSPEKRIEYAGDIHASGLHLLSFVNDILDLEKIENGTMEMEEQHFDLLAVVAERVALIEPVAATRDIRVAVRTDRDAAPVRMDLRMARQMLDNLLSNAVKFSHPGSVITVAVDGSARGGLKLEVRDTGIGMDPDTCARLFQPYTQADSTVARKFGGTGLGLSIVKRQADMHGAQIAIRSAPGRGTRIGIVIPPCRIPGADEEPRAA